MEMWESLIRMISALAVVLGLMILLALLIRRILPGQPALEGNGPVIRVLGTGYLGPRKSIALVAVAGEILIVGTTATQVVPLGHIKDPEQVERFLPRRRKRAVDPAAADASHEPRRSWLARVFKLFEEEGVWRVSASPPHAQTLPPRPPGWLARRLALLERNGRANVKLSHHSAAIRPGNRRNDPRVHS